jgi:hypothetical protein
MKHTAQGVGRRGLLFAFSEADGHQGQQWVCAVQRRRFPVGARPTRQVLQPEATGATVEGTKRLKPSGNACHELVTARVCRPQRE